eukprot:scaffold271_cov336-Pavlova_lutheri.AAC.4
MHTPSLAVLCFRVEGQAARATRMPTSIPDISSVEAHVMVCPTRPPASSSLGVSLGGLRARSGGGSRRPNGAGTRRALWRRKGSDTYVHRHYSPLNEVVIPFVMLHKLAAWKLASASPAYPSACPSAPHASTASRRPRERPVSALVLSRSLRRIHRASKWSCGFVPVVSCVPASPPTSFVAFEDERSIARTVHEVESHGIASAERTSPAS